MELCCAVTPLHCAAHKSAQGRRHCMMLGEKIVATTGQTELRHAYVHCHSTFGMILRKTRGSDLIDLQIPELLCWICAACYWTRLKFLTSPTCRFLSFSVGVVLRCDTASLCRAQVGPRSTALHDAGEKIVTTTGQTELRQDRKSVV